MSSHRKLLVFQIGEHLCGLPVEQVREVLPPALLARPPGLVLLLEGFLNLRGTAVPILRTRRLFALPATTPGLYTPLVLLNNGGFPLALLVDKVLQIASIPEQAILPIRDKSCFNDCAQAEVALEALLIHVLSPERLLLEKERRCLVELQAIEQRRLEELEAPSC